MNKSLLNIGLITDAEIFKAIHDSKSQFKELFTEISNELGNNKLSAIFTGNKGTKISMGNELQKCPYQVLDIFRDFDKNLGHNIRILNWWGHGLFAFVFFGKKLATDTLHHQSYFQMKEFRLAKGGSPWDYGRILSRPNVGKVDEDDTIENHLLKFGYLLWYKEIKLEEERDELQSEINRQLSEIFHFHRI